LFKNVVPFEFAGVSFICVLWGGIVSASSGATSVCLIIFEFYYLLPYEQSEEIERVKHGVWKKM
jgi:hypothetical protein